jgi:predicted Rossmann fold nucleotide-binding protein DprA/Smf involved in DNA uptake
MAGSSHLFIRRVASAANAMARNRYIYLAEAALVVHAGTKGGTITGAKDKHRWGTVWVKPSDDPESSNALLVQLGGAWCSEDALDIEPQQLLLPQPNPPQNSCTTAARRWRRFYLNRRRLYRSEPR